MDGIEKSEDNMEALRNDPNETIHKYFFKKREEIIELVKDYIEKNCVGFKKEATKNYFNDKINSIWESFYIYLPKLEDNPKKMNDGINYSNNNYSVEGKSNSISSGCVYSNQMSN